MSCPTFDELRNCLAGHLEESRIESIYAHAEACQRCAESIEQLDSIPHADTDRAQSESSRLSLLANSSGELIDDACEKMISKASELVASDGNSEDSVPLDPAIGTTIRDYELWEVIGTGGMGTVYRAWHTRLKRFVALKVLSKQRASSSRAIEHFDREMEAVGNVNHPHIVRALDAGIDDGTRYLVMDLVDGVDAAAIVRHHGRLPLTASCKIVEQVARGLDHAHQRGLVHRDVKPSNIMVTLEGQSLLMDLGLALVETNPSATSPQVLGTAHYMAPEQTLDSGKVDNKADVYSLGCTLYHLLCGQPPYASKNGDITAILDAHVNHPPPSVAIIRPEVPEDVVGIVHRMIHKSPAQRPSIRTIIERLAPFADGANLMPLVTEAQSSLEAGETAYSYSLALAPNVSEQMSKSNWIAITLSATLAVMMLFALRYGPWMSTTAAPPDVPSAATATVRTTVSHSAADSSKDPSEFESLLKLVSHVADENRFPLSAQSLVAVMDGQRYETTHVPGKKVSMRIFGSGDSAEPDQSLEAWDALEFKLKHPAAFMRMQKMWQAAKSSEPPSGVELLQVMSVRSDVNGTRMIQAKTVDAGFRFATDAAGRIVAVRESAKGRESVTLTAQSLAQLEEISPDVASLLELAIQQLQ